MKIKIIRDELKDFSALAVKSFEFWNNDQDDIYQKFYANKGKAAGVFTGFL